MAVLALALLLLVACSRPPGEEALRERIAEGERALEARDAGALMDLVDAEFAGPEGMDREQLRRYAGLMLLRQRGVDVRLGAVEVSLHGDRASARFDALVVSGAGLLPEDAGVRRVDTTWRFRDGAWVLVAADWSRPAIGG